MEGRVYKVQLELEVEMLFHSFWSLVLYIGTFATSRHALLYTQSIFVPGVLYAVATAFACDWHVSAGL